MSVGCYFACTPRRRSKLGGRRDSLVRVRSGSHRACGPPPGLGERVGTSITCQRSTQGAGVHDKCLRKASKGTGTFTRSPSSYEPPLQALAANPLFPDDDATPACPPPLDTMSWMDDVAPTRENGGGGGGGKVSWSDRMMRRATTAVDGPQAASVQAQQAFLPPTPSAGSKASFSSSAGGGGVASSAGGSTRDSFLGPASHVRSELGFLLSLTLLSAT